MNSCLCCGMPLRIGSLIVGSFEIIGYFLATLGSLWAWGSIANGLVESEMSLQKTLKGNHTTGKSPDLDAMDVNILTAELFVLTLNTLFFSLGLIMAIVLVVGVKKSIPSLVQSWVIVKAIFITMGVVHLIVSPTFLPDESGLVIYIIQIISMCLSLYFFMVIYTHLGELRITHHRGAGSVPISNTPYEKAEF